MASCYHAVLFAVVFLFVAVLPASTQGLRVAPYSDRKSRCVSQPTLVCSIFPTSISNATGIVHFSPIWRIGRRRWHVCDVRITATINNLTPGLHGFHIHTYGDLRNLDGSSTGGHFSNPWNRPTVHGSPDDRPRHWGDFGSIEADATGLAKYDRIDSVIGLKGIVGRGMTIHSGPDQGAAFQPSGASGPRVAFGVIGYKNPTI